MLFYVAKRILVSIPIFLGIMTACFAAIGLLPGDPLRMMLDPMQLQGPSAQQYLERRRVEFGLDQAMPVQFVAWARGVLQGDFGFSYEYDTAVSDVVADRAGTSLLLIGCGVTVAVLLAVPLGTFAAMHQNGWLDNVISIVSLVAISTPSFFLGLLGIYLFSLNLGVLPSAGAATLGESPSLVDRAEHLALPGGILAAVLVGQYVRYTRDGMLRVLNENYILTAHAKGIGPFAIIWSHTLRNALVPLITVIAIGVPALISGTVVIEQVFSWPGLGQLLLGAIEARDYPVILSIVMLTAFAVMGFNLVADVVVALLDPRVRVDA